MIGSLLTWAAARPEAPALIDGGRTIGYGALARGVRARAAWLRRRGVCPGDLVSIDAAGRLTFHGRSDDVINFGGAKVRPGIVEAVLLRHPAVALAAVVGVPDRMAGEVPVAFVVLRERFMRGALRKHCVENLEAGEVPQVFYFVREFPHNADDKIDRARLREMYLEHLAQQAGAPGQR